MLKKFNIFDRIYEFEDDCIPLNANGTNNPDNVSNADNIPFSPQYVRTVTMCLHISESCNLNCKYCFKKISGELSLNDIKRFIDCVMQIYPNADRYIIDMSGAGEPLLHKELALQIAKYCNQLSDRYLREFLPTFVTNGVLLTPETVKELQAAGILFGVSLDGTKENHDKTANAVFIFESLDKRQENRICRYDNKYFDRRQCRYEKIFVNTFRGATRNFTFCLRGYKNPTKGRVRA